MGSTHDSKSRIPAELLDRYLTGLCDDAERARVAAWMAEAPSRTLREGFRLGMAVPSDEIALALGRVRDAIAVRDGMSLQADVGVREVGEAAGGRQLFGNVRRNQGVGSGRTLLGGLLTGALTVAICGTIILSRRGENPSFGGVDRYETRADQQALLNLDDGTHITLAPRTTLRVKYDGTSARMVSLESGEAYFEVTHASEKPFLVRSGSTTTQVLGTAFLIRYDVRDPHVRVAVADGKVQVTSTRVDSVLTLSQGQVGDVTDSTVRVSTANDVTPKTEWNSGRVIFRGAPLSTVLQMISQWYGYQFRYADQTLGTRRVTMAVSTRSSAEALAAVEQVLLVNLTVVGDTVTLVPHPSRTGPSVPRIRTYDVWSPIKEVGR